MADTKLSALTALAVEPADTDELYINDGGTSKKIAWSTVKANIIDAVEGTAVLSTGETGGSKFLREDGDGTCSWQAVSGGAGDFKADGTVDMTGQFKTDVGTFASDVADGALAVGFNFNTSNAFSTAGAKLASWKNNGVEKAYIDKDGGLSLAGNSVIRALGTSSLSILSSGATATVLLANNHVRASTIGVAVPSDCQFLFTSTTSAETPADTGIARNAAGVVKITDGSTGAGQLIFIVPTSDPGITGALWNNAGTLTIS